jgi:hypothetical protein
MANLSLFSQIVSKLDRSIFSTLVSKHNTDKYQKGYNSWTHLISMLFCQFAKSQSVRDISNGLRSATGNLNHLGLTVRPAKAISVIRTNIGRGNCSEATTLFC